MYCRERKERWSNGGRVSFPLNDEGMRAAFFNTVDNKKQPNRERIKKMYRFSPLFSPLLLKKIINKGIIPLPFCSYFF